MRYLMLLAFVVFAAGGGVILHARQWPLYTVPDAPEKLSHELSPNPNAAESANSRNLKSDKERNSEWFRRLHSYETPRKHLSDLGRGLVALSFGLPAAAGIWRLYHRRAWMQSRAILIGLWAGGVWLLYMPFSIWYYGLREYREDYPWWADSIALPIFTEWIMTIVLCLLTSGFLFLVVPRNSLSGVIRFTRHAPPRMWGRRILFAAVIAFCSRQIYYGVIEGDEGGVITSAIEIVFLAIFASDPKTPEPDSPRPTSASLNPSESGQIPAISPLA